MFRIVVTEYVIFTYSDYTAKNGKNVSALTVIVWSPMDFVRADVRYRCKRRRPLGLVPSWGEGHGDPIDCDQLRAYDVAGLLNKT